MEKGALSDARFGEFAGSVVLLLHNTSHVASDSHQRLLAEKGGRGFPYLAFLDADGDVMAKQPYDKFTVDGFLQTLAAEVPEYRALKKKAQSGDKTAAVELLMKQVEFAAIGVQDCNAAIEKLGKDLTQEQLGKLENRRNAAELEAAIEAAGARTKLAKAGPAVLELKKAGHVPTDEQAFTLYRRVLLDYAEQQKDVQLFEEILETLRKRYAGNERALKQIVEPTGKRLEKLEEAGK